MKKVLLNDITLRITDGKHGDCEPSENSGYYFVSCKDVNNGIIDYENARQITEASFQEANKRTLLEPNDILLTNSGTIGRMALVKDIPETSRTTFQKSVAIIKADPKHVLPKYLYYQLQNYVQEFINSSNGSAQKNLLLSTMREFELSIHQDLKAQKELSDILSFYDDLIENNRKQIKLLEEAAQRLYKEWFVDLHFPGYETTPIHDGIPEGWEMTILEELIEFNPKYTVPKAVQKRVFPMSSLSTTSMVLDYTESSLSISVSGARFSNGDTLLARITPCLENGKTAYVDGLQAGEIAMGSTEFIVMQSKKLNPYMVYLLARSSDFRKTAINSMTGSDGRQRAQVDKLKLFPYLCPSQSVLDAFERLSKPMFEQIYNLNKQILGLTESRDRLLPKLMSGEIEVKK